jgi:RimJ/RimL family protein N-acetyltransferase
MPGLILTIKGEIIIRQCQPEDAMSYRVLRLEALKNEPAAFAADYEESQLRPDNFWKDRLKFDPGSEAIFFAETDGNPVGMTGIYRGSGKKQRHSATVWGVYVKSDFRGLHIAEAMVNACLDWARSRHVVIVKLGVGADNRAAIRCYERCGFISYGIEPKAGFYAGIYHDMNLMACPLD